MKISYKNKKVTMQFFGSFEEAEKNILRIYANMTPLERFELVDKLSNDFIFSDYYIITKPDYFILNYDIK